MRSVVRIGLALLVGLLGASAVWGVDVGPAEPGLVLYVWKSERRMQLVQDGQTLREFSIKLGTNPYAPKRWRGDGATPEGRYFVREKNANSRFHRFLGLNYPNLTDADRALDDGLIDGMVWSDIFFANMQRRVPPAATPLGGKVGIHGYGGRPPLSIDWTQGCIAVTDPEIDYLFDTVQLGTPVVIRE